MTPAPEDGPDCSLFRSPSQPNRGQDFAVALSWRPETNIINVLLSGMTNDEERLLLKSLEGVQLKFFHPMHIFVILCSMILERDAESIRRHNEILARFELDVRTRIYHDVTDNTDANLETLPKDILSYSGASRRDIETNSLDFDSATKKLNNTWAGLSFCQMRIENIGRFAKHIAENEKAFRKNVEAEPVELLVSLHHVTDEVSAFFSEIAYNQRVVDGQVDLVRSYPQDKRSCIVCWS